MVKPKRRAMSPEHASEVKKGGHNNEQHFAKIIGGHVNRGSHTDKRDVVDSQDRSHSVKSGTWWQVFLYGRERLANNTMFQALGDVATIMVECLDAYPKTFEEYIANKNAAKQRLRPHMKQLLAELSKPRIFKAFLDKALFDGGNAEYLSVYIGKANDPLCHKQFHIFHKNDVTKALYNDVTLANSQARNEKQTPEQKVVFCSELMGKQIGEIEDRHDSLVHYQEMKFRLNAESVFNILKDATKSTSPNKVRNQATAYGRAATLFK